MHVTHYAQLRGGKRKLFRRRDTWEVNKFCNDKRTIRVRERDEYEELVFREEFRFPHVCTSVSPSYNVAHAR